MSKIALITDSHAGIRGDSEHFCEYQEKFYKDVFFPKLDELGIKEVYHLGDFFDRRKYINFKTLFRIEKSFLEPLKERNIKLHILVGNHDVALKNTNKINSVRMLMEKFDNIVIYDGEPIEVQLSKKKSALIVPWINAENYADTMAVIKESKASACFGHFEFANFEMNKGEMNTHGMSTDGFEDFDVVCSGHYHHQSRRGNIVYLGAPFEYTWADHDDPRGFHVMDTDTLKLDHIRNPYRMFEKWVYDDSKVKPQVADVQKLTEFFTGKYVKVIVREKRDHYLFDRIMDTIYSHGPFDVQIIENTAVDLSDLSDEDLKARAKDTIVILMESVDTFTDVRPAIREKTKTLLKSLYTEALSED